MQAFAIGGAVLATFIALMLLTMSTYWLSTQLRNATQGLIWPLNQLAGVATYLQQRNAEIITWVWQAGVAALTWGATVIETGYNALFNIVAAPLIQQLTFITNQVIGFESYVQTKVISPLFSLNNDLAALDKLVNGFVTLNINALNFWRSTITGTINTVIIPSINSVITRVDYIVNVNIPTIQARLGVAENTLQVTLPAEIAQTKTDVGAVQREIARTTTAPGTGLLDRVTGLEKDLGQVLPWAVAIGLSIPIAGNLAKLGRNPCWCTSDGPLQDNGLYELALLMDLV